MLWLRIVIVIKLDVVPKDFFELFGNVFTFTHSLATNLPPHLAVDFNCCSRLGAVAILICHCITHTGII